MTLEAPSAYHGRFTSDCVQSRVSQYIDKSQFEQTRGKERPVFAMQIYS